MTLKHASPNFKTLNKLLVCKTHLADPRTGTALYKNIVLLLLHVLLVDVLGHLFNFSVLDQKKFKI